jgi:hypothetical protein
MSGVWDSSIRLVYAAEAGGSAALDTVPNGSAFDVLVNIKIGQNLMQVVDAYDLFVSVRNLSQSNTLLNQRKSCRLPPRRTTLTQTLQVGFDREWRANEGDLLDVIATFKVTAGVNASYSAAMGASFIVIA